MRLISGFRKLLIILNVLSVLFLVFACFIAIFPIASLPFLDVFGILVPPLTLVNILFLFFWFFVKRRYALVSLVGLLLGFLCFGSIYKFRFSNDAEHQKDLSIFTFNVQGFKSYNLKKSVNALRDDILAFIEEQDPDIICFQEMGWIEARQLKQYPYRYQSPFFSDRITQGIFSKYPITSSGSLKFPVSTNNTIFVDIAYERDTLRIYNIHLESFKIRSFRSLLKKDIGLRFLSRIQHIALKHREQTGILQKHREESPYPVVFCGDFNQPAYSPSFRLLSHNMKDSYRERGKGWGTTFKRSLISARIDFILADEQAFEVLDHQNFDIWKSDHAPVMARLRFLSD